MAGSLKKLVSRIPGGQKGFTLIEMIVVVGIIAVLAAVIIPNIGKFIGSGETGAKNAESVSVQLAMNAMMSDKAITTVTALGSGASSSNVWTDKPTGTDAAFLSGYLQEDNTKYFYCYDVDGQMTNQHETATVC